MTTTMYDPCAPDADRYLNIPLAPALSALREHGGFTLDPRTGDLVAVGDTTGFAIALPSTERVIEPDPRSFAYAITALAQRSTQLFADPGMFIGGWYSAERDAYMIELTEIMECQRSTAIALGRMRRQEGILDMATGEFIPTTPVAAAALAVAA